MKTLWFVNHGPDASHMWESDYFDRLRDAREFAGNLPLTPTGAKRPFVIERVQYVSSRVYGDTVRISRVAGKMVAACDRWEKGEQ